MSAKPDPTPADDDGTGKGGTQEPMRCPELSGQSIH
jgi:hypothetical protein